MPQLDVYSFGSTLFFLFIFFFFLYIFCLKIILPSVFKTLKYRSEKERMISNSMELCEEEIKVLFRFFQIYLESEMRISDKNLIILYAHLHLFVWERRTARTPRYQIDLIYL